MEHLDTILTVASVVLTVGIGLLAKKYSDKYGKVTQFLKDLNEALADGKITKEELQVIIGNFVDTEVK